MTEKRDYLRTSSLKKFIHQNDVTDPATGKSMREAVKYEEGITEEISFTLTSEKVQDFINKIMSAQQDPAGTGGVRISMYCRQNQNQQTGETFDGAGILVYSQKPTANRNGFQKRGAFQGGPRRSYPNAAPKAPMPGPAPKPKLPTPKPVKPSPVTPAEPVEPDEECPF